MAALSVIFVIEFDRKKRDFSLDPTGILAVWVGFQVKLRVSPPADAAHSTVLTEAGEPESSMTLPACLFDRLPGAGGRGAAAVSDERCGGVSGVWVERVKGRPTRRRSDKRHRIDSLPALSETV